LKQVIKEAWGPLDEIDILVVTVHSPPTGESRTATEELLRKRHELGSHLPFEN